MTRNSSSTPAGYERCPRCPREIARVHMREQQALAIGIFENGVDAADSVDSDESTGDFLATLLATVHDVRSCACPASLDDGLAVGPAAARRWPNAASPPSAHPARVPGEFSLRRVRAINVISTVTWRSDMPAKSWGKLTEKERREEIAENTSRKLLFERMHHAVLRELIPEGDDRVEEEIFRDMDQHTVAVITEGAINGVQHD